jgi:hypothetical protein
MPRRVLSFVLSIFLLLVTVVNPTYAANNRINPSRKELEKKIEEVAKRKGIPTVILKSIARVESVFKQYNPDGTVYTGRSGSIGLMQIHNVYGWFDDYRLRYDIDYNIEAGADVLLMKWKMANEKLPKIGDMNPNILEHWYFALWAYNSWVESNNPNMVPYKYRTWTKKYTYQQLIYMVAEKEYGQKITPIDPKLLPKKGLPSKKLVFDTPEEFHYGDIILYEKGDLVKVDVEESLTLRDAPNGKEIGEFNGGEVLEILEGPTLKDGFFWYRIKEREGNRQGWVARNWLVKVGDVQRGVYPFKDIEDSWAIDYIVDLHNKGIISGDNYNFYPNKYVTREEMCAFISKAFNIESSDIELNYKDMNQISQWAVPYIKAVSKDNIIPGFSDNTFRPKEYMTREEVCRVIAKFLNDNDEDTELKFKDLNDLSPESIEAIELVYENGIINGKSPELFYPKDFITRAEISKIIWGLLSYDIGDVEGNDIGDEPDNVIEDVEDDVKEDVKGEVGQDVQGDVIEDDIEDVKEDGKGEDIGDVEEDVQSDVKGDDVEIEN